MIWQSEDSHPIFMIGRRKLEYNRCPFQEPKSVPSHLTFPIVSNVTMTCVELHGFFHHFRKLRLHMWSFMSLGDYMYYDCGGRGVGNRFI